MSYAFTDWGGGMTVAEPTVLQRGDVVVFDGKLYRVGMVNPCRARLDPLDREFKRIWNPIKRVAREFYVDGPPVSISPDSDLPRFRGPDAVRQAKTWLRERREGRAA